VRSESRLLIRFAIVWFQLRVTGKLSCLAIANTCTLGMNKCSSQVASGTLLLKLILYSYDGLGDFSSASRPSGMFRSKSNSSF
jgi:hypothetical protein